MSCLVTSRMRFWRMESYWSSLARSWVVHVDTLKGSRYGNMKELPFDVAEGVARGLCCSSPATNPVPRKADFIDN